jgi:polyhydroxybutyrate depolymerase
MLVALPAVVVAVAVQLFSALPSAAQGAASPCQQPVRPGNSEVTLLSSGRERTAIVHVPPAAAGRPLPLVVGLHGAGGQFFEPYSGLSVLADSEGFIAVYPNPIFRAGSHSSWDIEERQPGSGPNDVQFISDLLDYVESNLCVDASRVYALGVSNGGGMAARAVCQLSSRFAGFASIAGGYKGLPPCQPTNPVSVIEVHGTADGSVPYNGVPPDRAGAVRPWLAAWRSRDGCRGAPVVSRIAPRVERYDWTHCAQGTAVEHLEIFGGNHQLPGGLPPDRGQTGTASAVWLAWSFLRGRVQAGPATPPSSQLPAGGASPGP